MRINNARRELSVKIVYYGPGLSGKTTNLVQLYRSYPAARRGDLVQLDTQTERTLFFDYFPVSMGSVGNYNIKVDLFTVPGQSFYHATRRAVLTGADGVVFVADSSEDREEANLVARDDMVSTLLETGRSLADMPHVFQWNKQDTPDALSPRLLNSLLNSHGAPAFSAVATSGTGVLETQNALLGLVFRKLRAEVRMTA